MATVAVVGSIITDLAVLTPRLPARGENLLARSLRIGPGGKGANAAVAVILVEEGGENTILVVNGANDHLSPDHVLHALAPHWGQLDALLVDFEIPPATVQAAVEAGRAHRVPVVVDAGPPRPYGPEIWGAATVLSPNRLEAATLVGRPLRTDAEVRAAARELLSQGPQAVVVKLRAAGALLVTQDLELAVPGFAVATVDTTGAGDAFMGALVVGLAEGMSVRDAVRWANAAGAIATTRVGTLPVMPRREEVLELLNSHRSQQGLDPRTS